MSVEFEENNFNHLKTNENKGLIGWIIKKGLAKNRKGAEYILLVIAIVCIAATAMIWMGGNEEVRTEPLTEAEIQELPEPLRDNYRSRQ